MIGYKSFLFYQLCCVIGGFSLRVGNPDDTAHIERPCPSYDKNCIREFFGKHAYCKKSYRQVPDPIIRPQNNLNLPRTNMTVTVIDQVSNGLNGRIVEFYINKDTDNLVIAVEFQNLKESSDTTYFIFHRRAKEPVVTQAFASVLYPSVIITAVIPSIDNLQLEKAECTAYANDRLPPTVVGPTAAESTDPQVQKTLALFLADLATNTQELFLSNSAFNIGTFIQYTICDFGLRLI